MLNKPKANMSLNHSYIASKDTDPIETKGWLLSICSVIKTKGLLRSKYLAAKIHNKLLKTKRNLFRRTQHLYINTVPSITEPTYPGNLKLEYYVCSFIRWNAIIIILRASRKNTELGGHISSFQSLALIYEVCFNHFFQSDNNYKPKDLIYFQGHSSPGIYARTYIEERLTEPQLNSFRQEVKRKGISSYPHPKLMPSFWQFPTVSMGLTSVNAIYQARFLKYLENRDLKDTKAIKVYAFLGDGELDEPESKGAISIASREKLNNLIFIINCNLQRLDGPVLGNNKIIFELENLFNGSSWKVIKAIWGSKWDRLLLKDTSNKLIKLLTETIDGDFQTLKTKTGFYIRKYLFGKYNETKNLVKCLSDNELWDLNNGGHDPKKIYAAFKKAVAVSNKPVVILFHTIKGYGMGTLAESKNIAHQVKAMSKKDLTYFINRFYLTNIIKDSYIGFLPYLRFYKHSKEYLYIHRRRQLLHGYVPKRLKRFTEKINLFIFDISKTIIKPIRTSITLGLIKLLNKLVDLSYIKARLVIIIADEARTFGIESLFKKIGIYNIDGQKYIPQDYLSLFCYREYKKGQVLQEGINELGASSSWLSASTAYSNNNLAMVPFYIYYSMFGFQRVGDLLWAAGDQQARGFLIGGVAGKTSLSGEGLQHADGHSHIQSLTIPNCISYDPTYVYEILAIIHNGIYRLYGEKQDNVYLYITIYNETYSMFNIKKGIKAGICKGVYKLGSTMGNRGRTQLLGSGSILCNVYNAAKILSKEYDISSDIYSVTSFTELARDGQDCERWNMLHPKEKPTIPYVSSLLNKYPSVAATDYMRMYAEQIRRYIPSKQYYVLGTDGFGLSDNRNCLRSYFENGTKYIVIAVLYVLTKCNAISNNLIIDAILNLNINCNKLNPRIL